MKYGSLHGLLGENGVAAVIGHGLPSFISLKSLRHTAKTSLHYEATIPVVERFEAQFWAKDTLELQGQIRPCRYVIIGMS